MKSVTAKRQGAALNAVFTNLPMHSSHEAG